jgi:predicted transcriptional regulator
MQFDDFEIDADMADLKERLSSWRRLPGVVGHSPDSIGESSINEAQVRQRQRRIASMCLNTVKEHDAFYASLKALIEKGRRDPNHQQRVEDFAAFALGVLEQFSAAG